MNNESVSERQPQAVRSKSDSLQGSCRVASVSRLLGTLSRACGWAPEVTLVKGTGVGGDKKPSAEQADSPRAWLYKHL